MSEIISIKGEMDKLDREDEEQKIQAAMEHLRPKHPDVDDKALHLIAEGYLADKKERGLTE